MSSSDDGAGKAPQPDQQALTTNPPELQAETFPLDPNSPAAHQLIEMREERFIGPLPPPSVLAQYPPDVRAAIVQMAQEQQKVDNEIRLKVVDAQNRDVEADRAEAKRGQVFAVLSLAIVVAGSVGLAAITGSAWGGGAFGAVTITSLVAMFLRLKKVPTSGGKPASQLKDGAAPKDG